MEMICILGSYYYLLQRCQHRYALVRDTGNANFDPYTAERERV